MVCPRLLPLALTAACWRGRVDAIVQSTDKNFMVPVGGAVISAPAGGCVWVVGGGGGGGVVGCGCAGVQRSAVISAPAGGVGGWYGGVG